MIPHIIHYCWFGKKPKPKLVKKCIRSWEQNLVDYKIMEWNEENFNVNAIPFTAQAYQLGSYAFVSDYARLCALQQFGGVYLDTDEEILKDISPLLQNNQLVAGFEMPESVMVGVLAAIENHPLIEQFKRYYETIDFKNDKGEMIAEPNPRIFTRLLEEQGLKTNGQKQECNQGICIYPIETFCAKNGNTLRYCITPQTYGVQYYAGSWMPVKQRIKWAIRNGTARIFGPWTYCHIMSAWEKLKGENQ